MALRFFVGLVLVASIGAAEKAPTRSIQGVVEMTGAANDFMTSLSETQRQKAVMAFADESRDAFKFTPGLRKGIPMEELNEAQQAAAKKLLAAALSQRGMMKAAMIMELEQLLAEMENNPRFRNAKAYYVSIFGKPATGAGANWAWRFEGHHLVVNITVVDGAVVVASPTFMGASPAKVMEGRIKGTQVLEIEETAARKLAAILEQAGKKAVYTDAAPKEIISAELRQIQQIETVGVKASDMDDAQWQVLLTLVKEYAHRHRASIAEEEMRQFLAQPRDAVFFAWAGSLAVGKAYYYRIQTPTILIEAANSQHQANHMHSVWRDAKNDFGRDALGEHFREHQH